MSLNKKIEIGILDFYRKEESLRLLISLKERLKFKCDIVYYDNGTPEKYSYEFLNSGLITRLVENKKNEGCGPATVQMYEQCKASHLLYLQCDHELVENLTEVQITQMINLLESGVFDCIDLAGNQGLGRFSERANLMNVEFYKKIPKDTLGGPGITNDQKYVEQWVQEYFLKNSCKIAHVSPLFFADRGYYSVRQLKDGSIFKHSCYTKEMWLLTAAPKSRFDVYPPLNDFEWNNIESLIPQWTSGKRGYIPNSQKSHSFSNDSIENIIKTDLIGVC
jgi:hypothetical protein